MALVPFPGQASSQPSPDDELGPHDPRGERALGPPEPPDDEDDLPDGRMTFLEHLDELRKRLTQTVLGLLVGFVIAIAFVGRIFEFVFARLAADVPGHKLIFTEPSEAFLLHIKIAVLCGLLIASPYIMWQVWLFIAPGLYANEKKLAIPFVVFSSSLFILGAAFSHEIVFPFAWRFFADFSSDILEFTPRVEPAFALYVKLLLAMGVVFQLPMLIFVLAKLGVVTARFLIRNVKYSVLIIFVVAAIITPDGNPVTQTMVAAPMFGLYIISIGVAWLFGRADKKE
ncbi:MAG: twin-arginine translocase subunit TatC [Acidobacteria bacterium]|nr:twin-arginine translocase subunit TatC [Acidobacteriota bacterium]